MWNLSNSAALKKFKRRGRQHIRHMETPRNRYYRSFYRVPPQRPGRSLRTWSTRLNPSTRARVRRFTPEQHQRFNRRLDLIRGNRAASIIQNRFRGRESRARRQAIYKSLTSGKFEFGNRR